MSHQTNIVRIKAVSNALGKLKDKVVFVGGATISLYPDRIVFEVRPTDDIDVIIEILNYDERAKIEEVLRSMGFEHDAESGVICRYKIHGIVVDIMPTDDPSIGFSNKWYPEGYLNSVNYSIDDTATIKILGAPYFIATKLEAHKNRGKNDGRTSQDFEDIVYVLENRATIWDEMNASGLDLKKYLRSEFIDLLKNKNLPEWIDCHVERGPNPATSAIIENIKIFVG
jgi:predicted nucleotidyltransferase